jgi:hypothetical protein
MKVEQFATVLTKSVQQSISWEADSHLVTFFITTRHQMLPSDRLFQPTSSHPTFYSIFRYCLFIYVKLFLVISSPNILLPKRFIIFHISNAYCELHPLLWFDNCISKLWRASACYHALNYTLRLSPISYFFLTLWSLVYYLLHILPTDCIYVLCMDLRTNSLYGVIWLIFVTEKGSAYFAVRTESLNAIKVDVSLHSVRSKHCPQCIYFVLNLNLD